jgi:hypothetical protein
VAGAIGFSVDDLVRLKNDFDKVENSKSTPKSK